MPVEVIETKEGLYSSYYRWLLLAKDYIDFTLVNLNTLYSNNEA
jgi:hypothetical protein